MGSSSYLTKLFDKLKLNEDEIPEFSVLSEVDEIYNGTGTWVIPLINMKNKKYVASEEFYVGTAKYCKFSVQINYEEKKSNNNKCLDFVSLGLKFVEKLPDGLLLKGDVSFISEERNVFDSNEFTAGENDKELVFSKTDGSFAGTDDLNKFVVNGSLILEWNIKMKRGSVTWKSDNRKFSLNKRYDFNTSKAFLFEGKDFSDVTFRIHGGEVTGHRSILSLSVPTFQLLFSSVASSLNYFKFKNIDKAPLEHMLQFVYSANIPKFDFTLASLLYDGAHKYNIGDLKNICSSYLGANLTKKNVFIAMSLAHKCKDIALKEFCIEFIKKCDSKSLAKESVHITK